MDACTSDALSPSRLPRAASESGVEPLSAQWIVWTERTHSVSRCRDHLDQVATVVVLWNVVLEEQLERARVLVEVFRELLEARGIARERFAFEVVPAFTFRRHEAVRAQDGEADPSTLEQRGRCRERGVDQAILREREIDVLVDVPVRVEPEPRLD